MRRPTLTIFYQYNPWQSSIGGIQTVISNFIKYTPENFKVRLVGTSVGRDMQVGQWYERLWQGKKVQFFPLITVENDDIRTLIPTTLKYTWALRRHNLASDFMHFHRIEPVLVTSHWQGEKHLFIHNDIQAQMSKRNGQKSILWQSFPMLYYRLEKSLIEEFSTFYSCNSNSSQFYKNRYPQLADRILTQNNGVDTTIFFPYPNAEREKIKQQFCQQHAIPVGTKLLLFIGRLHPQKDPLLLLEALAKVTTSPMPHLLIVGDGELKTAIATRIKDLNLEQHVSMLGTLPMEVIANLHNIASFCVLSSVYEGLPMTVLQSLACGVPVISTNSGDTPNLLQPGAGTIVHERSPDAMAAAMSHALDNSEQFSSQVCVSIAQENSAERLITQVYEQMYNRWCQTRACV